MENSKPYEFRKLSSPDVFPMFQIISKIGINKFTNCFENDSVKEMIAGAARKGEGEEGSSDEMTSMVGLSVILEVANVIISNVSKCEEDIYNLLAQTSNLSVNQIKKLDAIVFIEMIMDFVKKEEFKDFIGVVSKLFK